MRLSNFERYINRDRQ